MCFLRLTLPRTPTGLLQYAWGALAGFTQLVPGTYGWKCLPHGFKCPLENYLGKRQLGKALLGAELRTR